MRGPLFLIVAIDDPGRRPPRRAGVAGPEEIEEVEKVEGVEIVEGIEKVEGVEGVEEVDREWKGSRASETFVEPSLE